MKVNAMIGICIISVIAVTSAQAGPRVFGDGGLPEFLKVYDVDGDGVLSEEEKQAMKAAREERHAEFIAEWDKNGDGVLDDEEKAAAQEALRKKIEDTRSERFEEADTDDDGALSLEEFSAIPAVAQLAEKYPEKPALIFKRLDADDNDLVSLEEFTGHLKFRRHHRPGHK